MTLVTFKIIGIQIRNATSREVLERVGQPILSEVDEVGGLLGLIRTKIDNYSHYLVEAKYEPGNFNKILLVTLQATFSNINQALKEENHIISVFLIKNMKIIFSIIG